MLAYFFQDRIINLKLLSSDTISVSKDPALADGVYQDIIIQELEKMWQEQLIENLFEDTASTSNVIVERSKVGVMRQLDNTESYLQTSIQVRASLEDEFYTKIPEEITKDNQIHTLGFIEQNMEDQQNVEDQQIVEEVDNFKIDASQHVQTKDDVLEDNSEEKPQDTQQVIMTEDNYAEVEVQPDIKEINQGSTQENQEQEIQQQKVPKKPKMVFVLTQSRHGSTWLMDVLGFPDDAVPVFEPLNVSKFLRMYAESEEIREEEEAKGFTPAKFYDWREVYLARICICDFDGTKIPGRNYYGSILGLWYKEKRLHPDLVGTVSEKSAREKCKEEGSLMVPKTIRYYNMSTLYRVGDFGCDNFKVIHLVRDPRAVMNSRMSVFHELYDGSKLLGAHIASRDGQKAFDTAYMEKAADWMCSHHLYNYKLGINPPPWLEGRYKMVRYEDLAASPDYWTREILDFIGVEYNFKYQEYVYNLTHIKERGLVDKGTYSVEKETSEMIDKWKAKLIEPHWRTIERVCADMMRVFNYEPKFSDPDN